MFDRVLGADEMHAANARVIHRVEAVFGVGKRVLAAVDDVFAVRPVDRVVVVAAVELVEVDEVV